jgi:hypothetical protein
LSRKARTEGNIAILTVSAYGDVDLLSRAEEKKKFGLLVMELLDPCFTTMPELSLSILSSRNHPGNSLRVPQGSRHTEESTTGDR